MRAALSLLFGASLIAQPAFEVASIKPHDIYKPDGRKPGPSISGTTVSLIAMPLVNLMCYDKLPAAIQRQVASANFQKVFPLGRSLEIPRDPSLPPASVPTAAAP